MNTIEAIKTRRSIRKFEKKSIPLPLILEILEAGMYAPSAYNEQPWHFIIIDNRKLLEEIALKHPHAQMCKEAPCALLLCCDLKLVKAEGMWPQDLAACSQNVLLAAHEKNLGAVWSGIYPRNDRIELFQKLLSLPADILPFCIIPLGYPAEKKAAENRFYKERIHTNIWGSPLKEKA